LFKRFSNAIPLHPRLPLPDRSTKPVLISIDQEQQLLDIYNSMCDSTEGSSSRRGNPRPGYTGLYNMGNTCFMNATLQRLFASQVNACLADGHQHDASEFQLFLLDALHEDTNQVTKRVSFEQNYKGGSHILNDAKDYEKKSRLFSCSPVNKIFNLQTVSELSCSACGEQSATFEECSLITVELPVHASRTSLQQCLSSHFSQTVTKRVSFEQNYKGGSHILNDAKDYEKKSRLFSCSPVNKIFNLQTVSELSCSACGEQSATFEECSLITVELPVHASRTSLQQCLSSHFSQTTLDGDCRWNCPRCRAPKRASRLTKLWSLPPVVVVHLKRFSMENGDYAKNTMPVDFDPSRLDLSEYLHQNSPENPEPYRLYAVTNHCGRLNSGHYTALVCHGTTGEWLRFDDESVSSSSANGINTSEAYMLYYKRA
ncbi:ubiquitinyl hydrolase 1, partial [Ancylostoma duodenale]